MPKNRFMKSGHEGTTTTHEGNGRLAHRGSPCLRALSAGTPFPRTMAGALLPVAMMIPGASRPVLLFQLSSWWTLDQTLWALVLMVAIVLAVVVWVAGLKRRVHQQTEIIRARLQSEAALERRYSELVGNANDMIFTLDQDGNFTSVNEAAERILGYSCAELLRMNRDDVVVAEYEELDLDTGQSPGESRRVFRGEIVKKGGRKAVIEANTRLIYENGRPVGIQGIARDVTERERMQAMVSGQNRVLEMLALGAPLLEVLDQLTQLVEERAVGALCSVWLVDESGKSLQFAAGRSLPRATRAR